MSAINIKAEPKAEHASLRAIQYTYMSVNIEEDAYIVIQKLQTYPYKRLAFITIKDNTQKTKWCEISKVRTWMRRYSDHYIIIRGQKGGTHFHILAGIKPNARIKPQKGIHFHIKYLNDEIKEFFLEDAADREAIRKCEYYRQEKFDEMTSEIHIDCKEIIYQLNAMIKLYWKTKKRKNLLRKKKDQKARKILQVIRYLQQNLEENETIDKYVTHWW